MTPKLTQQMRFHLNGGRKFSRMVYAILADGVDTGITRIIETNGSPKYLKTGDELHHGPDAFDVLGTKGKGMEAWILDHLGPRLKAAE